MSAESWKGIKANESENLYLFFVNAEFYRVV